MQPLDKNFNPYKYLGGTSLFTLGIVSGIVGIVSACFRENPFSSLGTKGIIIIAQTIIIISFFITFKRVLKFKLSVIEKPSNLSIMLLEAIEKLYSEKHYKDVVRFGSHISRALWLSGEYSERVKIGKLVEEAAAKTESHKQQIIALIDGIGWTLVVMEDLLNAEENINNGIKKALKHNLYYWAAKGERHLAGIASKKGDKEDILRHLNKATEYAHKIDNLDDKSEMEASLYLGMAEYLLETNKPEEALKFAESSKRCYENIKDQSDREVKIHSRLGNIYLHLDKLQEAKDEFNKGYQKALGIRKDEVGKNLIGLSRIYVLKREYSKAKDSLAEAKYIFEKLRSEDDLKTIKDLLRQVETT